MATKDFVNYSPVSGSGNQTITVEAISNTGEVRITSLRISAKEIEKIINIDQKGYSNIIIIGNSGNIIKIKLE